MGFYEDRVFPYMMEMGTRGFRSNCKSVIALASGKVLEIGVGTGENLHSYPAAVESVVGIEPVAAMLDVAKQKLKESPVAYSVDLQVADARRLPFEDACFDTVVACLVFCTIPDPELAAAEVFRVLKPGGKLVFFEHVAADQKGLAWVQNRINPVWRKLACGCQLNRRSHQVFADAGFVFERLERYRHPKVPRVFAPVIEGWACKPA